MTDIRQLTLLLVQANQADTSGTKPDNIGIVDIPQWERGPFKTGKALFDLPCNLVKLANVIDRADIVENGCCFCCK